MNDVIKRFFKYIEIETKMLSVIPFFTALFYCFFLRSSVDVRGSVLFFIAMMLFNLPVTMINNYLDRREAKKQGYFSKPVMLALIFGMAVPAALLGLYLSSIYGMSFFLAGVFCFAVGIGYTYGPAPISKSPYGEMFSGPTEGFVMPFLVTAINAPGLVEFTFNSGYISVLLDLPGLVKLAMACTPMVICASNIMLANNICDIEPDKATRYTMPRHIGIKNALRLHTTLYIILYVTVVTASVLRVIPWTCLFILPTIIPVFRNEKRFIHKQVKSETFVLSVRNFAIIVTSYTVCMLAGGLLKAAGF